MNKYDAGWTERCTLHHAMHSLGQVNLIKIYLFDGFVYYILHVCLNI